MTDKSRFGALNERLRQDAGVMSRRGLREAAALLESVVQELDEELRKEEQETLSLQEASTLSGYSVEHLGRLVRQGDIPNAGRKGAPRIARRDLPLKPGVVANSVPSAELDCTQIVRSAITEGEG